MKAQHGLVQEKSAYTRIEPPCPYFGTCGGCSLQDLAYADQLALKRQRLQRAFAGLEASLSVDVVGLEEPWRYRNKAELTFGQANGRMALGYHVAGSFRHVVDLEDCLLLPQSVMRAARDIQAMAAESGLPAYHPMTHQGCFRYLLVRSSHASGEALFCLITTSDSGQPSSQAGANLREVVERMAEHVMAHHPCVVSFYWGTTDRLADVAQPEQLVRLRGAECLEDRIGAFRVLLHPLSFLQPTSAQADRLYTALAHALGRGRATGGIAWDLYCGLGLVGFYLAGQFRNVYGIDVEPHHLEWARRNAALNGLTNVEFRAGRVETLLLDRRFWLQEAKPDVIVVDPPRAGLHPQALSSLLAARAPSVAYLSCNVQSLVRDLGQLCQSFPRYRIIEAQAFDMFPQTNHVEVFVLLERESGVRPQSGNSAEFRARGLTPKSAAC